jgi:transcriptional regulator with XRE-family HTH domain
MIKCSHEMQDCCYHAYMDSQGRTTFGKALRAAIGAAHYTQASLARELRIDAGQVSRWVNDKAIPHKETAAKIEQILGADLSAAFAASSPEYELYVSAPITGLKDENIGTHNTAVSKVVQAAGTHVNSLFWPGERIRSKSDLIAPDIATERNIQALQRSVGLLYLQFMDIVRPSSALVELGCALGWRLKTTIIIQEGLDQPFMLENFGAVAATLGFLPKARIYRVKSVGDACDLITKNGRELLGL